MNATTMHPPLDAGQADMLDVQLLGEEEMRALEGGLVVHPALLILGGGAAAGLLGIAVGVAAYYFLH